jgi:hypothetical protein
MIRNWKTILEKDRQNKIGSSSLPTSRPGKTVDSVPGRSCERLHNGPRRPCTGSGNRICLGSFGIKKGPYSLPDRFSFRNSGSFFGTAGTTGMTCRTGLSGVTAIRGLIF